MLYLDNSELDIAKIAESGQCFRMTPEKDAYEMWAGSRFASAKNRGGSLAIDCAKEDEAFWRDYFDMDLDYAAIRSSIDPDDIYLTRAAELGRGIRILRQNPWEMIVTFIISQRRNIPSIRSCVEKLCSCGGKRGPFPSAEDILSRESGFLCSCSLGYRTDYVYSACRAAAEGLLDPGALSSLGDEELLKALLDIRGVGPKVANCILLFGYHRISAFPIDVWISRVLEEHYPFGFPFDRYKGYAGILQQYMFFEARK